MRVSKRQQEARVHQTQLEIEIADIAEKTELEDEDYLKIMGDVLGDLGSWVPGHEKRNPSLLSDTVYSYVEDERLTRVEAMQAVTSSIASFLKYALRYERHGNYDTPAGIDASEED